MRRQVLVLVCDLCRAEGDPVQTHEIDGRVVEVCAKCWGQRRVSEVAKRARPPKRGRRTSTAGRGLRAVS